jgi:hypothetical protein
MNKVVFVASKQPYGRVQDGETVITRLLVDAAAAGYEVGVVALADEQGVPSPYDVIEVPKSPPRLGRLIVQSAARGRSLIHQRFAPPELRRVLGDAEADVLVARRVYMAQAALDAGRVPPGTGLAVLVDVLESMVMRQRPSRLGGVFALEARRTRRDELACVRAASAVSYFSDVERAELDAAPVGPRLDLVLPFATRPAELERPVALFIGDRTWHPNATALGMLSRVWPRISRAVPDARLLVVGKPAKGEAPLPAGVKRLGYVDDLEEVWDVASVLLAPVAIGGGVRVKILDAARRGIPVIGTPAAVGSTSAYLPIAEQSSEAEFTELAVRLLGDRLARRVAGDELYSVNRALSETGFVETQISDLIRRAGGSSGAAHPKSSG